MMTVAAIGREQDRKAQRKMWRRLNRRHRLPRWLTVLLTSLGIVALACMGTVALVSDIGNGVIR